jgi:hypothetical protein
MVDPWCGARCAIRDTRQDGGERYHWPVIVVGVPEPVAAGRASDVATARSRAEAALGAYSTNERSQSGKGNGTDG